MIDQDSYELLEKWKDAHIFRHLFDNTSLNKFHDNVMKRVFQLTLKKVGTPPCKFSWFVMGSAGRYEQGIYSDQDHGLIYEHADQTNAAYFQHLGEELAYGLNRVGYPYCDGRVMSSNPLWTKSAKDWEGQIDRWILEESWETIRKLMIFFDARVLVGDPIQVEYLKKKIFSKCRNNPLLLQRCLDNIRHMKNAVGLFGNIFVESYGKHEGALDLKYSAFLPYVNATRYLALKEGITVTSTLGRLGKLMDIAEYKKEITPIQVNFKKLLAYRISLFTHVKNYEDIHYLNVKELSRKERKELKGILQDGKRFHQYISRISKGD